MGWKKPPRGWATPTGVGARSPARPVRSQLVHALVELDREYVAASPSERWEDFYARGLRERFSGD